MVPTGPTSERSERELRNLREENDRLRRRLALLSRLSLRITASLDLATALQEVVEAACALTGARYGALGIFDAAGRVQQFITHGVTPEEQERIGHLPQGLGLLGLLHQLQEPLRLSDLSQHHRSVGFPAHHPSMKTFLGVPLRHGDEGLGNLYLTEKEGGQEFTPEDESLLVLFASQAAMAIWNARLHHQVEAERQRLEALMETSPVGVFVVDAAGAVQLINREAQRVLGIPHQPGYGLERYEQAAVYSRPDGRPYESHDLPLQRALYRGETVRAEEVHFQFPDGRHVPTLVNATPLYSPDGQVAGAIAVIQDITPLEELEQLRSEFLGMVSHELKTPLTAIKGSAATVLGSRRTLSDAESRDLFQIIDEQSDRLRDLVDNLLDMTRIEAGSLSVSPEPADLPALLEEARATFARAGGGQEVQVQLPEGLPQVSADRGRVVQVLNNLLGNAGKFSPATAPIAILVEHEGTQVTVHVRDRGRGIPANRLPHLFRKFSQVHDDRRHNLSGSGLGLAICKGIVEAHGGRIWAESPGEGGGATFSFTLPVVLQRRTAAGGDPASDGTDPAPPAPLDTTRRSDHLGRVWRAGERTRVLAVDDEPQTLRYLQRSLEEAGYQPIVTSDPAQVVRLVELEEPDLVLLDLMLPGVSGFDLLGRIREFSGVPAIFLSARDQSDDAVRALRAGADDYITKPFAPSELLARIEATLRRRLLPDRMEVQAPFVLDNLAVNFAQRRVTLGDQPVSLSATEYKLLYELATHAGMVLTHTQLLQRVWGPEYSGETELVRSFIRNLRRKLGDDARRPRFIFTEPQVGYRMPKP